MTFQVRIATTPAERERIYRFRYEVYVLEMGKPLAAADHERGLLSDSADEGAILLYVSDGDRVIGTLRLHAGNVPEATLAAVSASTLGVAMERVALVSKTMVCQDRRGSAVFLALARVAMGIALDRGVRFGVLHCRPSLVGLYSRLGYVEHGERFEGAEVGTQVPMAMDLELANEVIRVVRAAEMAA